MPDFALIFRRIAPLAAAELPTRNAAARAWALELERCGVLRSAAPLEDAGAVVRANGVAAVSGDKPIASVLVVTGESLEAVTALALGHPGLAFGVEIEVRPVKVVRAS